MFTYHFPYFIYVNLKMQYEKNDEKTGQHEQLTVQIYFCQPLHQQHSVGHPTGICLHHGMQL